MACVEVDIVDKDRRLNDAEDVVVDVDDGDSDHSPLPLQCP